MVATGPATELGRISGGVDRSRPAAIAAAGRARPARPHPPVGRDRADRDRHVAGVHPRPGRRATILAGISAAIAAIPEEPPILLAVVLGLGAYRLLKRGVLVRRLNAEESLGAVA